MGSTFWNLEFIQGLQCTMMYMNTTTQRFKRIILSTKNTPTSTLCRNAFWNLKFVQDLQYTIMNINTTMRHFNRIISQRRNATYGSCEFSQHRLREKCFLESESCTELAWHYAERDLFPAHPQKQMYVDRERRYIHELRFELTSS